MQMPDQPRGQPWLSRPQDMVTLPSCPKLKTVQSSAVYSITSVPATPHGTGPLGAVLLNPAGAGRRL